MTDLSNNPSPVHSQGQPLTLRAVILVFLLGIVALIGVRIVFGHLQRNLDQELANEQARLFVGEEIVHGIQQVEKSFFEMSATSGHGASQRLHNQITVSLDKLRHDLSVLEKGGKTYRQSQLNIDGHQAMRREFTYTPSAKRSEFVMEVIEIGPLLDQAHERMEKLENLLSQRWRALDRGDERALLTSIGDIELFMKHLPPYFERLNENANRLFFDGARRLDELEADVHRHRQWLTILESVLIVLILATGSAATFTFLRGMRRANDQLSVTLSEMEAAKVAAEHASKAKSEFVSRMSHELRTPLNAILGFAELLDAEQLTSSQKNYVGLINNSGKHLMDLINAVLDHAKIEAGGLTLETIANDFPAIIDDVNAIVGQRAADKGLSYTTSISEKLPRRIMGDPTRLKQILINLLINAIKFTESGTIDLRVAADEGKLHFAVRDSGIGMDEEALGRLFKPFSQADESVTRRFGGTGLGLLISRELIEAMGGTVQVESAPGAGTCFWFWIPFEEAPNQVAYQPATAPPAAPAPTASNDLAAVVGGKVLLVDDNIVNQKLACAMLNKLGLQFDVAADGQRALECMTTNPYALVLMDMEMPVMDGVTATRQWRAREAAAGHAQRRLPVIAMTANALQADRERCIEAGMDGFIAKPISMQALRSELARVAALNGSGAEV